MKIGHGMIVPLLTPLLEGEKLDEKGLTALVRHISQAGLEGVFALGTTGESARLSARCKEDALRATAAAKGECALYAGVSGAGTQMVLENIARAMAHRPDALVCTLPYYFQAVTPQEQRAFFSAVLDASPVPMLLYNMPGNIGGAILPEVIAALSGHKAFAGVKDSSGDIQYFDALLALGREAGFPVLQGVEFLALRSLRAGAAGLVPSLGNIYPRLFSFLRDEAAAGRWENAARCQAVMDEINSVHKKVPGKMAVIACRKALLPSIGLSPSIITAPYAPVPEDLLAQLRIACLKAEAFEAALPGQAGGTRE